MGDPKYERWLTSQLKDLAAGNRIHPVKLRPRRNDRGITLFLDHWDGVKHHYTFLKPPLVGNRDADMEAIRRAIAARDEKERRISAGALDEFDPRQDLLQIIKAQMSARPHLHRVFLHLEAFSEGRPIPLGRVTPGWTRSFQEFLLTRISHNAAVSYMLLLRAVFHRLQDDGWTGRPIKKETTLRHEPVDRVYLTIEEVKKLAETPCRLPEIGRAFLFSCFSGLRISDVRKLRWGEVSKLPGGNHQIKFRQRKLMKKTGGLTILPLSREAVRQLYAGQDEKIIPHPEAFVFTLPGKTAIANGLDQWARQAGIKKHVSFHTGRHTFAVTALASGIDIYTVSKLLGHANLKNTEFYTRLLPEKMRADVDKLPELNLSHEAK